MLKLVGDFLFAIKFYKTSRILYNNRNENYLTKGGDMFIRDYQTVWRQLKEEIKEKQKREEISKEELELLKELEARMNYLERTV